MQILTDMSLQPLKAVSRIWATGLILVLFAFAACAQTAQTETDYFAVSRTTQFDWIEYDGVVDSRNRVDVIARVAGRVKAVHVRAGQLVKKGDVLLELESEDFVAKLSAAESRLSTAKANLERMEKEHKRIRLLAKDGLASSHDQDAATANWKSALAALDGAEAAVQDALTQLSYTTLKSPIDGIVADKSINPGDFAMPALASNRDVTEGPVLVTVYGPDSMWIEARIPERFSSQIKTGTPVQVMIDSADLLLDASFDQVVPVVDQANRSFIARIDLPPAPDLKLGMLGRVRFAIGSRAAIIVPSQSLLKRGQLDTVFVDDDGMAVLRMVRTGRQQADGTEVLSGLTAGERIVLNPAENLRDGDRL